MAHVDDCESCRLLVAEVAKEASISEEPHDHDGALQLAPPSSRRGHTERRPAPGIGDEIEEGHVIDGRFKLVAPLGRGAMGTVFRARDEKLGIDVALKLLHPETHADEPSARALAREVRAGRRVTHPNVCRLHDAGYHEGSPYITMELIDGETLLDLLDREKQLPQARALQILDDVASGLAAAHAQGIVHRDLKPANVMIEATSGRAILTDFGFAADMDTKQSRRLVGTPSFWAPEQARGEAATPASDVYSLGVLAYRLLAGREFALSDEDALHAVPHAYRKLIRSCVEVRPSARPKDASEALLLLRRARPAGGTSRRASIAMGVIVTAIAIWVGTRVMKSASSEPSSTPAATASTAAAVLNEPTPPPSSVPSAITSATPTPTSSSSPSTPASATSSAKAQIVSEKRPSGATKPGPAHLHDAGAPPVASSTQNTDPLYRH